MCIAASVCVVFILGFAESPYAEPLGWCWWSVVGYSLHRSSMIGWWFAVVHKEFTSVQFRNRALSMMAGHAFVLACVFFALLPVLRRALNPLFVSRLHCRPFLYQLHSSGLTLTVCQWLSTICLALDLTAIVRAVNVTFSKLHAEWEAQIPAEDLAPPSTPPVEPARDQWSDEVTLTEIPPAKHRDGNRSNSFEGDADAWSLTGLLKADSGSASRPNTQRRLLSEQET